MAACNPADTQCMEDKVDVWVMWLLITCGIIFVVTLIAALVRFIKEKKKRKNYPRPPPRVQSPVYFVAAPAQTQQQQIPVGWNVQAQGYGNVQPTYDQIRLQNAPPAYTTTYVTTTNVGRM